MNAKTLFCIFLLISLINGQNYLQFGPNISPTVVDSITNLFDGFNYTTISANQYFNLTILSNGINLISFGNTSTTNQLVDSSDLKEMGSEGFIVRSLISKYGGRVIGCDGNKDYDPIFNNSYSIGG